MKFGKLWNSWWRAFVLICRIKGIQGKGRFGKVLYFQSFDLVQIFPFAPWKLILRWYEKIILPKLYICLQIMITSNQFWFIGGSRHFRKCVTNPISMQNLIDRPDGDATLQTWLLVNSGVEVGLYPNDMSVFIIWLFWRIFFVPILTFHNDAGMGWGGEHYRVNA